MIHLARRTMQQLRALREAGSSEALVAFLAGKIAVFLQVAHDSLPRAWGAVTELMLELLRLGCAPQQIERYLRTRAGSLAAGASPTPSEALSPDGQALHDRIVALQQRLSKSLVAHGEGTPRS